MRLVIERLNDIVYTAIFTSITKFEYDLKCITIEGDELTETSTEHVAYLIFTRSHEISKVFVNKPSEYLGFATKVFTTEKY